MIELVIGGVIVVVFIASVAGGIRLGMALRRWRSGR